MEAEEVVKDWCNVYPSKQGCKFTQQIECTTYRKIFLSFPMIFSIVLWTKVTCDKSHQWQRKHTPLMCGDPSCGFFCSIFSSKTFSDTSCFSFHKLSSVMTKLHRKTFTSALRQTGRAIKTRNTWCIILKCCIFGNKQPFVSKLLRFFSAVISLNTPLISM